MKAPKGTCDTHIHFYDVKLPVAPGTPMPGDFTVPEYQALQKRLGLERVVVVQPNAYADDNTLTLACMKTLGSAARGVGVVKADVKDAELERLTKAGIKFEIVYGISRNKRAWYDNANAYRLGYQPQDDSEAWAEEVLRNEKPGGNPIAELHQGGVFCAVEEVPNPAAPVKKAAKKAKKK